MACNRKDHIITNKVKIGGYSPIVKNDLGFYLNSRYVFIFDYTEEFNIEVKTLFGKTNKEYYDGFDILFDVKPMR